MPSSPRLLPRNPVRLHLRCRRHWPEPSPGRAPNSVPRVAPAASQRPIPANQSPSLHPRRRSSASLRCPSWCTPTPASSLLRASCHRRSGRAAGAQLQRERRVVRDGDSSGLPNANPGQRRNHAFQSLVLRPSRTAGLLSRSIHPRHTTAECSRWTWQQRSLRCSESTSHQHRWARCLPRPFASRRQSQLRAGAKAPAVIPGMQTRPCRRTVRQCFPGGPGQPVKPDMSVRFAGLLLRNPVLAASGTFGYGVEFEDVVDLGRIGGFITKGLSLEPMAGNPAPRLIQTHGGMIQLSGCRISGFKHLSRKSFPASPSLRHCLHCQHLRLRGTGLRWCDRSSQPRARHCGLRVECLVSEHPTWGNGLWH